MQTKDREVNFDVETAIRVCRSAGYYEHAVFLADTHDQHDSYLKTQLEDLHKYEKALEYIGRLEFEEVSCATSYCCHALPAAQPIVTLLVGHQEGHPAHKKTSGCGGGGH